MTLRASDPDSPISATYSVDSETFRIYVGPFSISAHGVHQLSFYSVDTAGLQEWVHGQTVVVYTPPVSHVTAIPITESSPNFSVQWSATSAASSVASYNVAVFDNGTFSWWLSGTTATQAWFEGSIGHTYGFYSIARDTSGNNELEKTAPD